MTILRRIRHALVAFIAIFLVSIVVGPVEDVRTAWEVLAPEGTEAGQVVVTVGANSQPIVHRTHPPEQVAAKLKWQVRMTQHYADQDLRRGMRETAGDDSTQRALDELAGDVQLVNHQEASDGESTGASASLTDSEQGSAGYWRGHLLWNERHDDAEKALAELEGMTSETIVAQPITSLPGLPTRRTVAIAILLGAFGGSIMVLLDWSVVQSSLADRPRKDEHMLPIPASWIYVTPTLSARVSSSIRTISVVIIVGVLTLTALRTVNKPLAVQRLVNSPLAEVADLT